MVTYPRGYQPAGPGFLDRLGEANLPVQGLASLLSLPTLARAPRGQGQPVLLLPGFGAGDGSLYALRGYLRGQGFDADSWGLGANDGSVEALVDAAAVKLEARFEAQGAPLSLVGWSLGGVIARELTRLYPEQVAQVITLGTPIVGGPKYTSVAPLFTTRYGDLDELETEIDRRNRLGLTRPVTSIYSRMDGVVPWHTSVDRYNGHAQNYEVTSTHLGLGFHPGVYAIVARQLARPVGSGAPLQ